MITCLATRQLRQKRITHPLSCHLLKISTESRLEYQPATEPSRGPAVAVKGRKPTFAAVFDYCKIALKELGLNSTPAFKKAIEAYQKRTRRRRK